jgi:hypothetical protein
MKRSLIAVCLLLLSPNAILACFEDHNPGAGWLDQQRSSGSSYGTGAQALRRDGLLDVALFAGGLGGVILVGVSYRAMRVVPEAARVIRWQPATLVPLALPLDAPAFEPLCAMSCLHSEAPEWSSPQSFDVQSSAIMDHSPGIGSVVPYGVLI